MAAAAVVVVEVVAVVVVVVVVEEVGVVAAAAAAAAFFEGPRFAVEGSRFERAEPSLGELWPACNTPRVATTCRIPNRTMWTPGTKQSGALKDPVWLALSCQVPAKEWHITKVKR